METLLCVGKKCYKLINCATRKLLTCNISVNNSISRWYLGNQLVENWIHSTIYCIDIFFCFDSGFSGRLVVQKDQKRIYLSKTIKVKWPHFYAFVFHFVLRAIHINIIKHEWDDFDYSHKFSLIFWSIYLIVDCGLMWYNILLEKFQI